jgi:N-methylhydantoinase B
VFIFRPVFVDGELIAFAGSTAHHLDLGGGSAGLNAMASDVYQEGLLLPPLKFSLSRDWNGGMFERLLAANIRVPDLTLGDFNAQFAAKAIGIERIRQLCAKYGPGTVKATMAGLIDYAERQLRAAIRALPDGVCRRDAGDDIENRARRCGCARGSPSGRRDEIIRGDLRPGRAQHQLAASTESAVMSCIRAS